MSTFLTFKILSEFREKFLNFNLQKSTDEIERWKARTPVRRQLSGFWLYFLSGVCLSRFCPFAEFRPDLREKDCLMSICPDFSKKKTLWVVCLSGQPDKDLTELSGLSMFLSADLWRTWIKSSKFVVLWEVRRLYILDWINILECIHFHFWPNCLTLYDLCVCI